MKFRSELGFSLIIVTIFFLFACGESSLTASGRGSTGPDGEGEGTGSPVLPDPETPAAPGDPHIVRAKNPSGDVVTTLSEGATYSIEGEHFGPAPTVITWDDFDSHTNSTPLNGLRPPIGPTWDSGFGGFNAPRVSEHRSISGEKSARLCWNDGDQSAWASYFGWVGQGPFSSLYFTYYRYLEGAGEPWTNGSINHKAAYVFGTRDDHPQVTVGATMNGGFWNFTTNGGTNFTVGWTDTYPEEYEGFVPKDTINWNSTKAKWQRWEVYSELNEPYTQANDKWQIFHDNRLVYEADDIQVTEGGLYDDFRIGHMDNSHAAYDYLYANIDDLYIATSRARIEVGNSADFYKCTKRDIQVPISWQEGSSTFKLRAPSFEAGEIAYLFVVHADGKVSPGYPTLLD